MFSIFFIKRPIVAKVISIFLIIIGLIAIYILPIAQFPQITPPTISVTSTFTGSNASVVEELITKPLEEQINGVEGMMYMTSTSSSDGSSTINVYFEVGSDLDLAAVNVQNRVNIAMPKLPETVKQSGVQTMKKSTSMVQILTVTSTDEQHDSMFLSNFADINLLNELKQIKGVGDVVNMGQRKYSMRIWVDPYKMATLKLTVAEVTKAIQSQNQQAALGSVGSTPNSSNSAFQFTIVSKTRLENIKDFENIIVRQTEDGKATRLGDISRIELGSESYGWSAKLNNNPSAMLGISQIPGSNALEIAKLVSQKVEELSSRFPEGLKVSPTYDTTQFIEISIKEVVITLFQALLLVLLVVYFFLQSFRTTIIPALAIPVSLVGTFALLLAIDYSINTLTLFGLILAIGIVVDDAIIVVENVETNLDKDPNISLADASTKAMKEVFSPIIGTTLVLMAVFIPVTFLPGITGELYKQFAVTISFSVILSSIVALTLAPALCATILKKKDLTPKKKFFLFQKFDDTLDRFKVFYKKALLSFARKWYILVFIYFIGLGATYFAFNTLPTGFLPNEDQGNLIVSIELHPGKTLNKTNDITHEVSERISKVPGVSDTLSISGYNMISASMISNNATIFVVLDHWDTRTTPELSIDSIIANIKKATSDIDEATIGAFNLPSIPGISAVGGFSYEFQNLQAAPINEFYEQAQKIIKAANADERIAYAYTTFNPNYPQYYIDLNRDKIYQLNIDISDVFLTLQANLGSIYINDFNKFGQIYRVFMQADENFRASKENLGNFYIKNSQGDMVPLSTFATIKKITGPNIITHFNNYQNITISGLHNIQEGFSSSDAIQALKEISEETLSSNYGFSWSGLTLQEVQAGNTTIYVFTLVLIMVFLFLAALYESWMMPVMIMLPIPIVMFGALAANMSAGLINNIYTQIGLVLLIGMSSKNAILIIEFAKELRGEGVSILNAAIESSVLRLRPILMTIFSFLLGILPLVIATGAGAASRNSLGTAVFGGMLLSTALTLFFTPILYIILQCVIEKKSISKVVNDEE